MTHPQRDSEPPPGPAEARSSADMTVETTDDGTTSPGEPPRDSATVLAVRPPSTEHAIAQVEAPARGELVSTQRPRAERRNAARVYIDSLQTEDSRASGIGALRRVARVLDLDPDQWDVLPWHALTASAASRARDRLTTQHAPTTARQSLNILKGVLKTAWRLGQIDREQWMRVTDWSPVRGSMPTVGRELAKEEIQQLKAYCEKCPPFYGALAWAMFACALGGGLRRIELVRLRTTDLSDDARYLLVQGKGGKTATQPIDAWVGAAVESWLAQRSRLEFQHDRMFVYAESARRINKQPISKWQVWKMLQDVANAAGVAHFTPHDLRRTFITAFLREKGDLHRAKELARHASITMTARYDRRGPEETAEAAKVVGQVWFGETKRSKTR